MAPEWGEVVNQTYPGHRERSAWGFSLSARGCSRGPASRARGAAPGEIAGCPLRPMKAKHPPIGRPRSRGDSTGEFWILSAPIPAYAGAAGRRFHGEAAMPEGHRGLLARSPPGQRCGGRGGSGGRALKSADRSGGGLMRGGGLGPLAPTYVHPGACARGLPVFSCQKS